MLRKTPLFKKNKTTEPQPNSSPSRPVPVNKHCGENKEQDQYGQSIRRKRKRGSSSCSPYALRTKPTRLAAPLEDDDHTHIQNIQMGSCDEMHTPNPEKRPKIALPSNGTSVVHKPGGSQYTPAHPLSSVSNHETSQEVATGSQSTSNSISSGSKPLCSCCQSPPVGGCAASKDLGTTCIEYSFVCESAAMCGSASMEGTTPVLLKNFGIREHDPEISSEKITINASSCEGDRDKVAIALITADSIAADKDPIPSQMQAEGNPNQMQAEGNPNQMQAEGNPNQMQAEGSPNQMPPLKDQSLNLGDSWADEVCLDELFSLGPSKVEEEDEDDLLRGICPEDLSMSFNISCYVDSSRSGHGSSDTPRTPKLEAGSGQQEAFRTPKERPTHSHSTPIRTSNKEQSPAPNPVTVAEAPATCIPGSTLLPGNLQAGDSCGTTSAKTNNDESPQCIQPPVNSPQTKDKPPHRGQPKRDSLPKWPQSKFTSTEPGSSSQQLLNYPKGTFYGLPMEVLACLEEYRGIKKLYDWQDTCLRLPSVVQGRSLIYSLPTSGGKTLVAEVLILRQLLVNQKDVLFILPFVSIVQEKVRELTPFASSLGFAVEEYAGSKGHLPPRRRRKKKVVYIATIEKANGLVNCLIELDRIHSLGLVVIDELHMIGDGGIRGATLETCLAKIQFCSPQPATTGTSATPTITGTSTTPTTSGISVTPTIQKVGMSATLSNIQDLATFLRAEVYSSDFRPVELCEYVKMERCVYSVEVKRGSVDFLPQRDVQDLTRDSSQIDPDQLSSLVLEVIPHSSCLLFCPTKKNCQNVALLLARCLPRSLLEVKRDPRRRLLNLLNIEAAGVCPILAQTVPHGIAYHHSGLMADERRLIEEAYLEGTLCLLACTSTLAAGVNLPAKRVILRSPYVGNQFISRSQYKQMIGRAGRTGLCDTGESILIVKHQDRGKVIDLLSGPYDRCVSSLLSAGTGALYPLMLSLIGLKLVRTTADLHAFFQHTLLSIQHDPSELTQSCHQVLSKVVAMGYITMETGSGNSSFSITSLGRATYKGCLPVEEAHMVYRDLEKAQQCLVLSSDLHLLLLAIPPDLTRSIQPNWMVYFDTLTCLGPSEMKVAELVGVSPAFLSKKAVGVAPKMSDTKTTLYHKFYISLMLHCLLKTEGPQGVWSVSEYFQCSRGFIQSIINSTAAFASCLVHFTEELPELWSLHLLLPSIIKRLAFTASIDVIPLMEIPGVKQGRARQLLSAGFRTPQDIASADPQTLSDCVEHLFLKNAKRLIQAAKVLLSDQAEVLMEEAEELMSLLPQDVATGN